jgi:acyl-CoA thioester hydrolase
MNRSDFTFAFPLRVRWAEVDRQDVVFNGNYFLYFDVAIAEYWRAVGISYPDGYVDRYGTDIFAVKATAEYLGSARYDDMLDVRCRVGRFGRTSMTFLFGIWRGEDLITKGELVYVNADPRTKSSAPWPEEFKAQLLSFERVEPETGGGTPR